MEDTMQVQFEKLLRKAIAEKNGLGPIVDDIEKIKPFMDKVNTMQDVIKGDPGATPQRGVDYLTDEEMQQIRDEVTPRKGEHYNDGQNGRDGFTPVRGVDYLDEEEMADIRANAKPIKGKDYFTPADIAEFKKAVTPAKGKDYRDGSDGANPDPKAILDFFKGLKGKDAAEFSKVIGGLIDISNVRNAQSFMFNGKKYQTHELMHGGGSGNDTTLVAGTGIIITTVGDVTTISATGSGNTTTTYVDLSSQTDGVTKTFTVPSGITAVLLVVSDAPNVFRPVVDYTISGTVLTLGAGVNAPSNGATLILVYNPEVNPPVSSEFTTVNSTETVNGVLTTYTFSGVTTQPLFIIVDNFPMQAVTNNGTTNWTWNAGLHQATFNVTPQDDVVAITAAASTVLTASEIVNGVITAFTFAGATSQPWAIISDNVLMEAVANDGTVNWTWSGTIATMSSAPAEDIVALSAPSTGVIQASELVNGSTTTFTFASAVAQPSFVVSDGAMMRATSSAGTVNWTWASLQATLTAAPQSDVIALV